MSGISKLFKLTSKSALPAQKTSTVVAATTTSSISPDCAWVNATHLSTSSLFQFLGHAPEVPPWSPPCHPHGRPCSHVHLDSPLQLVPQRTSLPTRKREHLHHPSVELLTTSDSSSVTCFWYPQLPLLSLLFLNPVLLRLLLLFLTCPLIFPSSSIPCHWHQITIISSNWC